MHIGGVMKYILSLCLLVFFALPVLGYSDKTDIEIQVVQNYDHYNKRYRKVSRVESVTFRNGYPGNDIVHCNRANYDSYSVYLEDLAPGDRFQVRVTWDDGSRRTIDKKVTGYTYDTYVIDEPAYYDQSSVNF